MDFYDKETYMIPKWVFVAPIFRLETRERHSDALTNVVQVVETLSLPKSNCPPFSFLSTSNVKLTTLQTKSFETGVVASNALFATILSFTVLRK